MKRVWADPRMARRSARRLVLLGGPGGYLTVLPVGDPRIEDRYAGWTELARANVPRSRPKCEACIEPHLAAPAFAIADAMKRWALDVYGANA